MIGIEGVCEMLAEDFRRSTLSSVREAMLTKGWTRQTINSQVRRVKSIFRWAEEQEYVSEGKWGSLQLLPGLKVGRTPGVPEQREILPVIDADVEATLPLLSPTVARMVRFHRLTACRPQDVCALAWERIDRSKSVWLFEPKQHKTAHHGHSRVIRIGAVAQAILGTPGTGFVFSPTSAYSEVLAARRASRKTPLYPSHNDTSKPSGRFFQNGGRRIATQPTATIGALRRPAKKPGYPLGRQTNFATQRWPISGAVSGSMLPKPSQDTRMRRRPRSTPGQARRPQWRR